MRRKRSAASFRSKCPAASDPRRLARLAASQAPPALQATQYLPSLGSERHMQTQTFAFRNFPKTSDRVQPALHRARPRGRFAGAPLIIGAHGTDADAHLSKPRTGIETTDEQRYG